MPVRTQRLADLDKFLRQSVLTLVAHIGALYERRRLFPT
jgi:hypothetical protein